MKDLKQIIEDKVATGRYTKTQIYNDLGRSASSFEYALNKMSFSLQEFETIAKILDLEPNHFFDWLNNSTQILVKEPVDEYRLIKKDTKNVSGGEVEFLRGQIAFLNRQVEDLIKTVAVLSNKN